MRQVRIVLAAATLLTTGLAAGGAHAAPANDDRAHARPVPSAPYTDAVDTAGATMETGETPPDCLFVGTGASIWYRFTPSQWTEVIASTAGSDYDTVLAVYADETPVRKIGCNDDAGADDSTSTVRFRAPAPTSYLLQVTGAGGATGHLSFSLDVLPDAPGPIQCDACDFVSYALPRELAVGAGEPTIGVNPRTNAAMFLALSRTIRVTWDDSQQPTWSDVTGPATGLGTNDPILWTDPVTGRTFIAQLRAYVGAIVEYTDDDGETWTTAEPGLVPPSWDHQSIGGGPHAVPIDNPIYPRAVYYCAQAGIAFSQCARSDNGGLTWGAPVPMNTGTCEGLHGHVVVGPDGSVYVPHRSCRANGATQGVMVSRDGAHTWHSSSVIGTVPSRSDPAVATDRAGRLYFAAASGGRAVVSVSEDRGDSWTEPFDVGAAFGLNNVEFPTAVAGDDGRAAVAFLGTTTPGDDQAATFTGEWHLYLASTVDAGKTWSTQDLSPHDPVQRGCIWLQGGSNPCRNLLDFMGMTADAQGRVLVGYADGCISDVCVGPAGTPADSRASRGTIARQISGPYLLDNE